MRIFHRNRFSAIGLILVAAAISGCRQFPSRNPDLEAHLPPAHKLPNEEVKTTLPPYIIEPPDTLLIDAIKVIPKVPYLLEALDIVRIQAENVLPDAPIQGAYQIEADGTVNLGPDYGTVKIAGFSTADAAEAIRRKLLEEFRDPLVSVLIEQTTGAQQISGTHQVLPQGTVNLGGYGEVYVTGMTLEQAKYAIEEHLEEFLEDPEVFVDIAGINSKVYYIITDGGGLGDRVTSVPIQGGETVLDAMAQLGGLPGTSTKDIWIARPSPDKHGLEQRLPIRWNEITKKGITATNYQILPGDRIFIRSRVATQIDTFVTRITQPISSISGAVFLLRGVAISFNESARRGNNVGF
jgi:polysaccharide export outer membrane protein